MYFSHDDNAQDDVKCLALLHAKGNAGYGVFWRLIERMNATDDCALEKDFDALGYALRVKPDFVASVVCDFGLFEFSEDGTTFWSPSLRRRRGLREEKKRKLSEAGRKGGLKRAATSKRASASTQQAALEPSQASSGVPKQTKTNESKANETQLDENARGDACDCAENVGEGQVAPQDAAPNAFDPERLIDAWNANFSGTDQAYRGLTLDPVSYEHARGSWEQFGDMQTFERAFQAARNDKFAWLLRDALKPENIQRLLAKGAKYGRNEQTRPTDVRANFADSIDWDAFNARFNGECNERPGANADLPDGLGS